MSSSGWRELAGREGRRSGSRRSGSRATVSRGASSRAAGSRMGRAGRAGGSTGISTRGAGEGVGSGSGSGGTSSPSAPAIADQLDRLAGTGFLEGVAAGRSVARGAGRSNTGEARRSRVDASATSSAAAMGGMTSTGAGAGGGSTAAGSGGRAGSGVRIPRFSSSEFQRSDFGASAMFFQPVKVPGAVEAKYQAG